MATSNQIVIRALKRANVIDAGEGGSASADDVTDALTALNEMMFGWRADNVDVAHQEFVLSSTFRWFVPPATVKTAVLTGLDYKGTWNASTNSPALSSATGTAGHLYRVSTAGSTVLDDVASWVADDFAIFDGIAWLKSQNSIMFDGAVVAMLAVRLCEDYGSSPGAVLVRDAKRGWGSIMGQFLRPDPASFNNDLVLTSTRRYFDHV